jgi:hypothetical protein
MEREQARAAVKVQAKVKKYENGRTPEDGEPDEIVTQEYWLGLDGLPITDPARIAQLDASL